MDKAELGCDISFGATARGIRCPAAALWDATGIALFVCLLCMVSNVALLPHVARWAASMWGCSADAVVIGAMVFSGAVKFLTVALVIASAAVSRMAHRIGSSG